MFSKVLVAFSFILVLPFVVSAQEAIVATSSPEIVIQTIVEPNVHITGAILTIKGENSVDISFELNNSSSAQIDVLYGIELVAKDEAGINKIIDAEEHQGVIKMAPKSSAEQTVSYDAPIFMNGEYELYIVLKTATGFPLASVLAGMTSFKGEAIPVTLESCGQPNAGKGLAIIESGDTAVLSCSLINTTKSVQKIVLRTELSFWGKLDITQATSTETTLSPSEKKSVLFTLPLLTQAGKYKGVAYLSNDGEKASPSVYFEIQVNGESGIISNITLDKDYYNAGDTATVLVYVQTSLENGASLSASEVSVSLGDGRGSPCATIANTEIGNGIVTLSIPVERECTDPHAVVTLSTQDGLVLDTKTVTMQSPREAFPMKTVLGGIAALVLALFSIGYWNFKKRRPLPPPLALLFVFVLPIAFGFFLLPNTSSAATLSGSASLPTDNFMVQGAGSSINFYTGNSSAYVGSILITNGPHGVGLSVSGSVALPTDNFVINAGGNSINFYTGNSSAYIGSLSVSGGTVSGSINCNTDGWGVYGSGNQMVVSCAGPGGALNFSESCGPFGVVISGNGGTMPYYSAPTSSTSCSPYGYFTCVNGVLQGYPPPPGITPYQSCSVVNTPPIGAFDGADCNNLWGWAADPDSLPNASQVSFSDNGASPSTYGTGSDSRPDVYNYLFSLYGKDSNAGFKIPMAWWNYTSGTGIHTVSATALDTAGGPGTYIGSNTVSGCGIFSPSLTQDLALTPQNQSFIINWKVLGLGSGAYPVDPSAVISCTVSCVENVGTANDPACGLISSGPESGTKSLSFSNVGKYTITNTCSSAAIGTPSPASVTHTVTASSCSNSANNPPTCNTCTSPLVWNGSSCVPGTCSNGANNPPTCNTCTSPLVWNGSSCVAPSTPDLTAGSISPTTATAGTAKTFSATISNIGTGTTGAGFTNLFQKATSAAGAGATDIGTFVRSTALVAGGTASASLSYSFPSSGTYYMRACADKSSAGNAGVITESNEGNNCGAWTTIIVSTATCSNGANNPPTCTTCTLPLVWNGSSCVACTGGCGPGPSCNNGATNPPACNTFTPTVTLTANPETVNQSQSSNLTWSSTNATSCTGTGFSTGNAANNSTGVSTGPLTQNPTSYSITCTGSGGSVTDNESITVLNPSATISTSPNRVTSGSSSTITWTLIEVSGCSITRSPSTSGWPKSVSTSGSSSSGAITGQTIFTLSCPSLTPQSVTVNIIPDFTTF